jgi:hypothetical protein
METDIVDRELSQRWIEELKEISSMMQGLIRSVNKKRNT